MLKKPDFMIIGAMKCATSTLHEQLAHQPGIAMSDPKEPCFFSDDPIYDRGIDWYRKVFPISDAATLYGESSTHYTKLPTYPDTVNRIKQHLGTAKFIYMMRHPVDRLISHYIHDWTELKIREPLNDAIDKYPNLIDYGCYAKQLKPFIQAFGADQILPVFFDRFRQNRQQVLEEVCQFLDYDGAPKWVDDMTSRNVSSERLRQSAFREALNGVPVVSEFLKTCLPNGMKERIKNIWRMDRRPTLSPENRARLIDIFNADLSELGKWLDLPLQCDDFVELTATKSAHWQREITATIKS